MNLTKREILKRIDKGKTVKVELEIEEGYIKNTMISGDFFAYPIEEFENLQNAFKNKKATKGNMHRILEEYSKKITLSGITFSDLEDIFSQFGV